MAQFPHDEFVKEYIPELCGEYGIVTPAADVSSERREIDIYFQPNLPIPDNIVNLGLLGKMIQTTCLMEFYRNCVTGDQIRECLSKLFDVQENLLRKARREKQKIDTQELPMLWIITPTISEKILTGFGAKPQENWPQGIYFLAKELFTGIVAIHQLPVTKETLWLRTLGRDKVQLKAIEEIKTLPENYPYRDIPLELIYELLRKLEANQKQSKNIDTEEVQLIMTLRTAFRDKLAQERRQAAEEGRQEGRQEGLQEGVRENLRNNIISLLGRRFGDLPWELVTQINNLEDIPKLQQILLETISVNSIIEFQDLV